MFKITSRAFKEGEMIPAHYTADGEDVSPPLDWIHIPDDTQSLALICDDPDAPGGTFTHWVVYNIPRNATLFPEALPNFKTLPIGARQGINDFGQVGYKGPAPPSGVHRYFFKLFALDEVLDLEAGATRAQFEKAAQRHIVGKAQLMGKYQRT
jgi:Raf kinase inhibitor-like YbhB/YbcL family protein